MKFTLQNHLRHITGTQGVCLYGLALVAFLAFGCQLVSARGDGPAYAKGGKLKFILKVVDDEGKPVENATVKVHLQTGLTIQGALFDTASDQKLKTDADGRAMVAGKCVGEGDYFVQKEGYYAHYRNFLLYQDKFENGKWLPYGEERLVLLRKIHNPTRLHADFLENLRWLNHEPTQDEQIAIEKNKNIDILSWDGWLDLEVGDWIAPYGAGRTPDICLTVEEVAPLDKSRPGTPENHLQRLRIHFSNPDDGGYAVPLDINSQMQMPHCADENAEYQSNLHILLAVYRDGNCVYRKNFSPRSSRRPLSEQSDDQGFFLRLRTVKDAEGKIVSANYAKIYGINVWVERSQNNIRFGKLYFFYNPEPNDTNLEYSSDKNVFDDAFMPMGYH